MELSGKQALVCGASRGIGAAVARQLSQQGARVLLVARSEDKLEEVKASLTGDGHRTLALDLTQLEEVKSKVGEVLKDIGAVSILICNSGGPKAGPLLQAEPQEFLEGFTSHVLANHLLVQMLMPGMRQENYGRIINIISTSVKIPIPNLGVSNTIRGAVASWAKSLANELGPMGITVNNVLPGFTATDRLENLKTAAGDRLKKTPDQVEEMWKSAVPLRRFAKPEETAEAVGFLASSKAAYINGINLPVDGGRTGCL